MKRNDLVTVVELKIGDRFYKATDKKKTVFEMVVGEKKQNHFRTYKYFCCEADLIERNPIMKDRSYKAINKDTQVVFLRHQEN